VAAIEGSQITINQGEGAGVVIDQVWNIYAPGAEITDPDTGKILGRNENEVGKIKINRTTTKLSYGEVVAGNGITIGCIARPQQTEVEPTASSVPAPTPTTGQKPAGILDNVKGDF
jgi:hypothetical protein